MPVPSATVFRDVSVSLRKLIVTFISELSEKRVTFVSPGEIADDGQTKLSVFLYRLNSDPWTKNQLPTLVEGENGKFIEVPPPEALNLNYVMVPYSRDPETELYLADKLRRLFYNRPVLEGKWLQGNLKQSGNKRISIVPIDPPMEKIYNLWAGFAGRPYKLCIFYNLVPTFIPGQRFREVAPVGTAVLGSPEDK